MLNTLNLLQTNQKSNFWQIQRRIRALLNNYLTLDQLNERLQDLPVQFTNPQSRPWKQIDWQAINRDQIIGIDIDVFLAILKGSLDTEAPIRGYTQTSRQYLQTLHPSLARFVGGKVNEYNELIELGLWEKEERQHTPALQKIYHQLTGEKITPTLRTVRGYLPTDNPHEDLYRHGLHRVATEYGATCLYIWMMAHTTGALYSVLEQLAIDEINHMTKFWGFGVWVYPNTSLQRVISIFIKTRRQSEVRNNLFRTLSRMMKALKWEAWTLNNKITLILVSIYTIFRLLKWNNTLTPQYLNELFGMDAH
ncbi:hypothetical protein DSM106972_007740 [Dulcicalothrix desertica PCC 7102]|uniref:Ferritin-like domain-containing protein n=1 Tax=Dulcicalothrix desertica PCC 7102 TaxID=232991 RepID=A0A433VW18_9CYAN|nr:ferritin-like domain-containing protein [Dulcicalothrix desertica]RUT10279.1 hypothetical protein DSM106972_007740 [Dulcicalothrix desertica PCC 7102]TWH40746.1 hypothetical protein CAL7102_10100 [Dulcicalothrix desertica PCC 7102]